MAWGNPGYPQAGAVTIIPLPNGDVELFGPDGHSLGTLTPGGGGTPALKDVLAVGADANAIPITGVGAPTNPDDAARLTDLPATPDLGTVVAVGADAGGVTLTNLGAPSNPDDAARLTDVGASLYSAEVTAEVNLSGTPATVLSLSCPAGDYLVIVNLVIYDSYAPDTFDCKLVNGAATVLRRTLATTDASGYTNVTLSGRATSDGSFVVLGSVSATATVAGDTTWVYPISSIIAIPVA